MLFYQILEHWPLLVMVAILLSFMAGVPNTGLGLHNLFHDDRELIARYVVAEKGGWRPYLNSPAIFVQCFATVFAALLWGLLYTLSFVWADVIPPDVMDRLFVETGPYILVTSLIFLVFGMFSFSAAVGALQPHEWARCAIGTVSGLVVAWVLFVCAQYLHPLLDDIGAPYAPLVSLMIPATVLVVRLQTYRRLITGVAVITLLALILLIYAAVNALPEFWQWAVFVVFIFALVFCSTLYTRFFGGTAVLKFEVPGIVNAKGENHYAQVLSLSFYRDQERSAMEQMLSRAKRTAVAHAEEVGGADVSEPARPAMPPESMPPSNGPDKIDPLDALKAWRDRVAPDGQKPKLMLVATSGGAYRASFWTAVVLDKLAERDVPGGSLEGICSNIRLITGASGGMVGGAYFTAMVKGGQKPEGSISQRMQEDILRSRSEDAKSAFPYKTRYPLPGDSLSPVAQQLLQSDLPGLFIPGIRPIDRGTVLEDQWLTLDTSFGDIRREEALGLRPSIIFSPMLVETGQPLLITNLDMQEISFDHEDETVEFFDWFPHSRDTFKLKTAVRLNAAFPFVAPAVALPTEPYRRVVDAGYYDNYGVDLAVSYLSQPDIRDWVAENTSGAMVLQIRAFPFTQPGEAQPGDLARALQFITTPLEGAGAARGSTMRFRNSQSLRRLENLYRMTAGPNFLRTAVMEVNSETSLSWYIPTKELDDLEHHGEHDLNEFALQGLEAFWAGEAPPTDVSV